MASVICIVLLIIWSTYCIMQGDDKTSFLRWCITSILTVSQISIISQQSQAIHWTNGIQQGPRRVLISRGDHISWFSFSWTSDVWTCVQTPAPFGKFWPMSCASSLPPSPPHLPNLSGRHFQTSPKILLFASDDMEKLGGGNNSRLPESNLEQNCTTSCSSVTRFVACYLLE